MTTNGRLLLHVGVYGLLRMAGTWALVFERGS